MIPSLPEEHKKGARRTGKGGFLHGSSNKINNLLGERTELTGSTR